MKLEASVEIERPISKVWEWYAVDHVRNHPRWNPDLELEQISVGPMGVGTKIRRRSTMGETPVEGEMEITGWEPPHAMAGSIRDGDVQMMGGAALEERGPARTFLTISADMPWLDDPERAGFIQGMMERSVANMKRIWLVAAAFVALVACSSGAGEEGVNGQQTAVPSESENAGLVYVSLGDSWPEGAHCDGCRTFPQLHAEALEQMLGRPITLKELTGQAQPYFDSLGGGAASLLEAIKADEAFRDEVATGDIIVIATGPNEIEQVFEPIQDGTCGGQDDMACVDELRRTWERNFDAILDEIETLRDGRPTAIRLVNAANAFVDPSFSPEAARGFAAIFEALTQVLCDNAEAHGAVCVDVRPVLNGPDLNQPVNDSSQESMDAVAELLVQTGVPELE